ncbi:MAG: YqgE/AlgH family protein [Burkholderiales bacterium]|jgi:putative transcriptional regulator|nr:YqgE/AlgH family protein [Burkholderiales bacterium]
MTQSEHPNRLTGYFLLAMPKQGSKAPAKSPLPPPPDAPVEEETPFSGSLIYLCEHNDEGAFGIVVNRQTGLTVEQLIEGAGLLNVHVTPDNRWRGVPVYWGGPVRNDRGFILHQPLGQWQTTLTVSDDVGMTTSRDLLEAMASGNGPDNALVSLGYAGWTAGQLEQELAQNVWVPISCRDAATLLFRCAPDERVSYAIKQLGVDPRHFTAEGGNA